MTLSIVAREDRTGALGVATATGSLAVGAQVPHCAYGVGAMITQGHSTNRLFASDGMPLLRRGRAAEDVLRTVLDRDRGRDLRQAGIIDARGRSACWTGTGNGDHKGHIHRDNLLLAGNILAGPEVLDAMQIAFDASGTEDLGLRLLAALEAGQAAGGDRRGTCSAALRVDDGSGAALDLRVDYSLTPVADLAALYERSMDDEYRAFLRRLPDHDHPHRY